MVKNSLIFSSSSKHPNSSNSNKSSSSHHSKKKLRASTSSSLGSNTNYSAVENHAAVVESPTGSRSISFPKYNCLPHFLLDLISLSRSIHDPFLRNILPRDTDAAIVQEIASFYFQQQLQDSHLDSIRGRSDLLREMNSWEELYCTRQFLFYLLWENGIGILNRKTPVSNGTPSSAMSTPVSATNHEFPSDRYAHFKAIFRKWSKKKSNLKQKHFIQNAMHLHPFQKSHLQWIYQKQIQGKEDKWMELFMGIARMEKVSHAVRLIFTVIRKRWKEVLTWWIPPDNGDEADDENDNDEDSSSMASRRDASITSGDDDTLLRNSLPSGGAKAALAASIGPSIHHSTTSAPPSSHSAAKGTQRRRSSSRFAISWEIFSHRMYYFLRDWHDNSPEEVTEDFLHFSSDSDLNFIIKILWANLDRDGNNRIEIAELEREVLDEELLDQMRQRIQSVYGQSEESLTILFIDKFKAGHRRELTFDSFETGMYRHVCSILHRDKQKQVSTRTLRKLFDDINVSRMNVIAEQEFLDYFLDENRNLDGNNIPVSDSVMSGVNFVIPQMKEKQMMEGNGNALQVPKSNDEAAGNGLLNGAPHSTLKPTPTSATLQALVNFDHDEMTGTVVYEETDEDEDDDRSLDVLDTPITSFRIARDVNPIPDLASEDARYQKWKPNTEELVSPFDNRVDWENSRHAKKHSYNENPNDDSPVTTQQSHETATAPTDTNITTSYDLSSPPPPPQPRKRRKDAAQSPSSGGEKRSIQRNDTMFSISASMAQKKSSMHSVETQTPKDATEKHHDEVKQQLQSIKQEIQAEYDEVKRAKEELRLEEEEYRHRLAQRERALAQKYGKFEQEKAELQRSKEKFQQEMEASNHELHREKSYLKVREENLKHKKKDLLALKKQLEEQQQKIQEMQQIAVDRSINTIGDKSSEEDVATGMQSHKKSHPRGVDILNEKKLVVEENHVIDDIRRMQPENCLVESSAPATQLQISSGSSPHAYRPPSSRGTSSPPHPFSTQGSPRSTTDVQMAVSHVPTSSPPIDPQSIDNLYEDLMNDGGAAQEERMRRGGATSAPLARKNRLRITSPIRLAASLSGNQRRKNQSGSLSARKRGKTSARSNSRKKKKKGGTQKRSGANSSSLVPRPQSVVEEYEHIRSVVQYLDQVLLKRLSPKKRSRKYRTHVTPYAPNHAWR